MKIDREIFHTNKWERLYLVKANFGLLLNNIVFLFAFL